MECVLCVCVVLCVRARACVCVYTCVYVCVHPCVLWVWTSVAVCVRGSHTLITLVHIYY